MNYEQHFQDVIRKIKIIQKNYPKIAKIVLFGSRARKDQRYNSDIDLLVFAPKGFESDFLTFAGNIGGILWKVK